MQKKLQTKFDALTQTNSICNMDLLHYLQVVGDYQTLFMCFLWKYVVKWNIIPATSKGALFKK